MRSFLKWLLQSNVFYFLVALVLFKQQWQPWVLTAGDAVLRSLRWAFRLPTRAFKVLRARVTSPKPLNVTIMPPSGALRITTTPSAELPHGTAMQPPPLRPVFVNNSQSAHCDAAHYQAATQAVVVGRRNAAALMTMGVG